MKRLRSSDDLDSYSDKKEASISNRSASSHRSFYYNKSSESQHKGSLLSSRYDRDRSMDDDGSRESSRLLRKRSDHDLEGFDRRKGSSFGFDRYNERKGYGGGGEFVDRDGYSGGGYRGLIHRSDSFSGSKREFPKGFRSHRDRSRHEGGGSTSSWRRIGSVGKEFDDSRGGRGSFMDEKERKGLRDVKSPSWSKDSGSEQSKRSVRDGKVREKEKDKSPSLSRGDSGSEQQSKMRLSPRGIVDRRVIKEKERSSPSWSSGQSRSVEVKKNEDVPVESPSSSEMEEGELEPEAKAEVDPLPELLNGNDAKDNDVKCPNHQKTDNDGRRLEDVHTVAGDVGKSSYTEGEGSKGNVSKLDDDKLPIHLNNTASYAMSRSRSSSSSKETETESINVGDKEEEAQAEEVGNFKGSREFEHKSGDAAVEQVSHVEEVPRQETGINLESGAEVMEAADKGGGMMEENEVHLRNALHITEGSTLGHIYNDKGKSIAVSPADNVESAKVGEEARDGSTTMEIDAEGPSTRGFELFSTSPVKKPDKVDQLAFSNYREEKQALEPLDLSLSLPNVLLPIGAQETSAVPGSPGPAKSVQSWSTFPSDSEGFTMSMSFSGSQSFFHNPSCSLTQNSLDLEQSVKSRPIFAGVDWQALAQSESKQKEISINQQITINDNGSVHHSQKNHGNSNGHLAGGNDLKILEGSSQMPKVLDRQMSFHKQVSGGHSKHHDDIKSPSQSVGSHEMGSNYSLERKHAMRDKHGGSIYRPGSYKEIDYMLSVGSECAGSIVGRVILEPLHEMAAKFNELRGESLATLKERVREFMLDTDKRGQLLALQRELRSRSDMNLDVLLHAHRAQLEILVALKTDLPEFLQVQSDVSSSHLAEVFLNLRCRNLTCGNALPVDECDCKVCGKKNGFCSNCMCLVCSKFDMATNTCSWVGCDICLHWCHVDCALREMYIRNGQSPNGVQGTMEMQFHCVACDHPSEMFGFVKEVFQNFARGWTAEILYRELEYVKRIFRGSKDLRGKRLFEIADHTLARLANKANLVDMYNYIMSFLNDSELSGIGNKVASMIEQGKGSNGVSGPKQDIAWLSSGYSEKSTRQAEDVSAMLPSSSLDKKDRVGLLPELPRRQQNLVFDELDSIIRIKQAESSMFQARADDARREAEGLKRIAIAKNEKVEEEYASRIAKLRLVEAEEMRKQKYEELQALEKAHHDYINMKIRMEADIKGLLLKMEATKRNLAL